MSVNIAEKNGTSCCNSLLTVSKDEPAHGVCSACNTPVVTCSHDAELAELRRVKLLYIELFEKIERKAIYLRKTVDGQAWKDLYPKEIRDVHRHYMYELEELLK